MKTLFKKSLLHSASLLLTLFVGSLAIADDTEVYVGSDATTSQIRPNIVFIIDNSGSMDGTVAVPTVGAAGADYDPTVNYNASPYNGGCNPGGVYWSGSSSSPPACNSNQQVNSSAFQCESASFALSNDPSASGFYLDRFARFSTWSDIWREPYSSEAARDNLIECEDDWGVHGDGGGDRYPADLDNGGPWIADTANAISWANTSTTYKFYSANYVAWYNLSQISDTEIYVSKLNIVKSVLSDLMVSMSDVNIALARFNYRDGGHFFMPMAELTHGAGGNDIVYDTAIQNLIANTWTPLAETLYETYLFFKGSSVHNGDPDNHPDVLNSSNTSLYESPIEDFCQKNFVILLTDGEPTYDTQEDYLIEGLPDFASETGSASCSGDCLDELADYMNGYDCRGDLPDKQSVLTYTIGFGEAVDQQLLLDTATKGGGSYYPATDTAGLADAFSSILTDILAINTSFVAPAVSVNAFNRFTHRDELYYALFRPGDRPTWNGNVKKFKLTSSGIVDANGDPAVDPNTEFFDVDATSFWTDAADAPDGPEVEKGGAAGELTLTRNIYTNTGTSNLLSDSSNRLHEDNTAVTKQMLGDPSMSAEVREEVLQYARGVDLKDDDGDEDITDARRRYGDPIHAKPVLLTYGGTEDVPDMTLFVGTNAGYLHAIDISDGTEQFSFVPRELLPNLPVLLTNSSSEKHPYGLDGPLTYWFNDANNNGVLLNSGSVETDEHIYLYQGMRRGGRNYYALDVSERSNPKLLWTVEGGSAEFSELGQSWSAATHAKLLIAGTATDVVIFGGGYDTNQDSNETAEADSEGRAIYIVNAETGAKIWQAGPPGSNNGSDPDLVLTEMTNSIPADITVIDSNADGYADRIYAADMRAQLWRIDLNNENDAAAELAKDIDGNDMGGVIAKLGGSESENNRRFYYAPDISLSKSGLHYNIAIGSGYRSHPLDTDIHDSFYIVRDGFSMEQIRDRITAGLYITPDGTFGADGMLDDVTSSFDAVTNYASYGCYINLIDRTTDTFVGEKSLAKSLTFGGEVMFTTFEPTSSISASSCSPSQGVARLYTLDVEMCTPPGYDPIDGPPEHNPDPLPPGIPPPPTIVITPDGPVVLVGTTIINMAPDRLINKTYWRQN